jgi:hypothetical protein
VVVSRPKPEEGAPMKRREFTYASLLKSMTIAVLTK